MKNIVFCLVMLPLLAGTCWASQKPAPPEAVGDVQRFVAVRSNRFVASTESLTNAEANCAIITASGAASVQCHPTAANSKDYYHYNSALIVDGNGMGYVIACRRSLVAFWCKEFTARTVILGRMQKSGLSIVDGDKVHDYFVLTSTYVGLAAAGLQAQATAAPAPALTPPAPAPSASVQTTGLSAPPQAAPPARPASAPSSDPSAACVSTIAACVSFLSDPPGADIYVDEKFVGNTPSSIVLSVGSHQIRMEEANRKPWTRKLETSIGSKITIRGTFEAASGEK